MKFDWYRVLGAIRPVFWNGHSEQFWYKRSTLSGHITYFLQCHAWKWNSHSGRPLIFYTIINVALLYSNTKSKERSFRLEWQMFGLTEWKKKTIWKADYFNYLFISISFISMLKYVKLDIYLFDYFFFYQITRMIFNLLNTLRNFPID